MEIKTYPEMNETIKDLLSRSEEPINLYILARIEELERKQVCALDRSRWNGCYECLELWCGTCVKYSSCNMVDPCITSCIKKSKHKPVNFCKKCGRPLTEEAWAELERRIGGNDGTADNETL